MTIHVSERPPHKRFSFEPIYGDCLYRVGVKNNGGGFALIDANATVKVGDLVHCSKVTGAITTFIKQVKEINGDSVIVWTAYEDESRDFQFEAAEIMGTVIETYGKFSRYREYVRPNHSRETPKE
jgi:hypothetical protein